MVRIAHAAQHSSATRALSWKQEESATVDSPTDLRPEYVWPGYNSRPGRVQLPEPSDDELCAFVRMLIDAGLRIPLRI